MNTTRHAMIVRSDARAMGAVTALGPAMRSKPRMGRALTDTICTRADGSQYIIARRNNRNAAKRVARATIIAEVAHRTTAADLPNAAGNLTYD